MLFSVEVFFEQFDRVVLFVYSTHMQDLKDVTSDILYENYRAEHMQRQLQIGQKERK